MPPLSPHLRRLAAMLLLCFGVRAGLAAERVQLSNGFSVDCAHHEQANGRTRLFLSGADASYMDVPDAAILSIAALPPEAALPVAAGSVPAAAAPLVPNLRHVLSAAEMHPLLAHAGEAHRVDADLLASVVRAESAGRPTAVSRTGARGLMQLMPSTAASLGVRDAFQPEQNVNGGAAYLDRLLLRYHDDIALALAAYNAGPGAVDRYHGVPPFRETRAYVARVILEFNRRKASNRRTESTRGKLATLSAATASLR